MKLLEISADKTNRGFTLIELLLVIAILVIITGLSVPIYGNLQIKTQINENISLIIQTLRTAKERSISRVNDSAHGIYFEINPGADDKFILYQGSSYASRNSSYDRETVLDSTLHIITNLTDNEVNFSKGLGLPNNVGTITLSHDTTGVKNISINSMGIVQEIVP